MASTASPAISPVLEARLQEEPHASLRRAELEKFRSMVREAGWVQTPVSEVWRGLCFICKSKVAEFREWSTYYECPLDGIRWAADVPAEAALANLTRQKAARRREVSPFLETALSLARTFDGYIQGFDNAMACCPFHQDRRPSFSINLENGLWRCHGCNARGNALTLVRMVRVLTRRPVKR